MRSGVLGGRSGSGTTPAQPRLSTRRALRARLYATALITDGLAILSAFSLAAALFGHGWASARGVQVLLLALPLFYALVIGDYVPETLVDWRRGLFGAATALVGSFLAVTLALSIMLRGAAPPQPALLAGFGFAGVALLLVRIAHGRVARQVLRGRPLESVLLLDGLDVAAPDGVTVVDARPIGVESGVQHPFVLDRLAQAIGHADRLYVACAAERRPTWAMALQGSALHVELLIPELETLGALGTSAFAGVPTVVITTGRMRARDEMAKRAFDLAASVLLLTMCLPLLCFIALLVKSTSKGGVFFVQKRVGRGNRLFDVIKFRTMRAESADLNGDTSAHRSDSRVTTVGRFLRATSLDEIPQLLNILRGEMSFVGPRPHAVGSLAGDKLFWEIDHRYHYRHACKPGLTGLAQVRGHRGATLRREDLVNRLRADLEYINGWSLMRDLRIMIATVRVVIHRDPVSPAEVAVASGPRRFRAVEIEAVSWADAVSRIVAAVEQGATETFAFCNMHTFNLARRSAAFARSLSRATVFNDGVGMDIASRFVHGARFPDNLNGTDLVPEVLRNLAPATKVFLIGSAPGVAQQAAERLSATYGAVEIVGCHHGFTTADEDALLAERVRASGARLLLLGMGNPRQELWAERWGARTGAVTLCVGAFIDFAAGVVPRAPRWVRRCRGEWLFRLAIEPRRMFGRYVTGGVSFAAAILYERSARHELPTANEPPSSAPPAVESAPLASGPLMLVP